jgi:hypothetical protein
MLVACGAREANPPLNGAARPEAVATATIAVTPTAVVAKTATVAPTVASSPITPQPTLPPTPTLTPDEETALLTTLIDNDADCPLPCWWGITPGVTALEPTLRRLAGLGFRAERDSAGLVGADDFGVYLQFEAEEGTIRSVAVSGNYLIGTAVENAARNQAFAHGWREYSLKAMFARYGVPSRLFIYAPYRPDPGSGPSYKLILFYDDQGVVVQYHGPSEVLDPTGSRQRACLDLENMDQIKLFLYPPGSEDSIVNRILPPDSISYLGEADEPYTGIDWERATGMSLEALQDALAVGQEPVCVDFTNQGATAPTETPRPASAAATPTPLPSPTPVPTLETVGQGELLAQLMQPVEWCQLPCWWQINLGTPLAEVDRRFRSLGMPRWTIYSPDLRGGGKMGDLSIGYANPLDPSFYEVRVWVRLYALQDKVAYIEADVQRPAVDYGLAEFQRDWQPFFLDSILEALGPPAALYLSPTSETYGGAIDQILRLYYPEQGITVTYVFHVSETAEGAIELCLDPANIYYLNLSLFTPNPIESWAPYLLPPEPESYERYTWEQRTGQNVTTLYESFEESQLPCVVLQ